MVNNYAYNTVQLHTRAAICGKLDFVCICCMHDPVFRNSTRPDFCLQCDAKAATFDFVV